MSPPPKMEDVAGERHGRWTLVRVATLVERRGRDGMRVLARCDCGTERILPAYVLRNGSSKSCGCRRAAISRALLTTHGMKGHPLYKTWKSMRNRCNNSRDSKYVYYGGRGIAIDPRWDYFPTFLADMGERPPGRSLDRIDNDGPYSPENCRWATRSEQMLNRRPMGTALLRTEAA